MWHKLKLPDFLEKEDFDVVEGSFQVFIDKFIDFRVIFVQKPLEKALKRGLVVFQLPTVYCEL